MAFFLTISPHTLSEDAGETETVVTITLSDVQSEGVTMAVSLSGSAEEPSDYTAVITDVTVPAGAVSGSATLVITPVDDGLAEGDETIMVSAALGSGISSAVTITLTDPILTSQAQNGVNSPPTFDDGTGPLTRSVAENSTSSTAVGDPVAATDPDSGDTLTYTLTDASGLFTIASTTGQIQVTEGASPDYETATSTTVTVSVSDGRDEFGDQDTSADASVSVTITITNVIERPRAVTNLTATALSPTRIRLDWTASDTTGLPPLNRVFIQASYRDSGTDQYLPDVDLEQMDAETHTYTGLTAGTRYTFHLHVQNTDGPFRVSAVGATTLPNTAPATADFTRNVLINTELSFSASDFPFNDGDRGDSLEAVTIVSIPDSSRGSLKRYQDGSIVETLSSGRRLDHTLDEVNSTVFVPAQDFVGVATFTFRVEDQSGAESSVATTTIDVQGANNAAPTFDEGAGPLTRSVPENSEEGTAVGDPVAATDPDSGDTLTYTLSDASGLFTIASTTGQIQVAEGASLNYETASSTTVTVSVSDGRDAEGRISATTDASVDVTIDITDVKPPVPVVTLTALSEPRKMRVSWTHPQTADHAPVARYEVRYFKLMTASCDVNVGATSKDFPASARAADLPFDTHSLSIEPGVEYCVQVRAITGEGRGVGAAQLTPWPITVPTSEDFRVYLPEDGRDLSFSATDFPFTDSLPNDSLKQVKIVTLPESSDGVLKWTASGGSQATVPAGQSIDYDDLDTLVFVLDSGFSTTSDPHFGPASFTFKVIDQTDTESSEVSTTTIWSLYDARISSMEITSSPAVGDTYTQGETIQVTVTFDKYVVWDLSANGADFTIQFEEDPQESWMQASLVTDGNATGTVRHLVFEHTVAAGDSSPNGLRIYPDSGVPIRPKRGATIQAEHGGLAVWAYSARKIPARDPKHKVAGDLVANTNSEPAFTQTGPLSFSLSESATSGASVGNPITAQDADTGDILIYSLSGTSSASFAIDASGQITVGAGTFLDFEGATTTYSLVVNVRDGKDNYGRADTAQDDSIDVTISITDVTEPSELPVGISATVLSSTEVRVDWSAPVNRGRTAATAYELKFNGTDGKSGTFTLDANTFTKTLTDLMPGEVYAISMRAKNADGFSAWKRMPLVATNPNSRPTSADFSKNAVPDTDLRFFASDFPFADADIGDILKEVRITALPQPEHGMLKWSEYGLTQAPVRVLYPIRYEDLDTLIFTPAATGTASFTFSVQDQRFGVSAASYTVTIYVQEDAPRFTETIPLTRSIVENSSAGAIVGAKIAASDPNDDTITYTLTGEDAASFAIDGSGQVTVGQGVTLDHESDKAAYTMFVEIHDGRGRDGSLTSSDSAVTDALAELTITVTDADEPPPAPTGLSLFGDAPGSITAQWIAPNTAGIPPVTGYGVEYRRVGDSSWTSHLNPSQGNTATSTTIGGLTEEQEYAVRVWAVNHEGASGYTSSTLNVSPTPRLVSLAIVSDSGDDGVYGGRDRIRVRATFNMNVQVTGTAATGSDPAIWPEMRIELVSGASSATRVAALDHATANGDTQLDFVYRVRGGDDGADGIRIPANAVSAPEGSAITGLGKNALLNSAEVAADSSHLVDGVPPVMVGTPVIASTPAGGSTYQFDESIYLDVTFSERVRGTDILYYPARRSTGGVIKLFYESGSGSSTLRFSYKVKSGDKGVFTVLANSQIIAESSNERVTDLHGNATQGIIPADITLLHPMDGDTQVNDPPSITTAGPLAFSLNEHTPPGSSVGVRIRASDPNSGDTIAYSLTGSASDYFDIDSQGRITVGSGVILDYESIADPSLALTVNISDGKDHIGMPDGKRSGRLHRRHRGPEGPG